MQKKDELIDILKFGVIILTIIAAIGVVWMTIDRKNKSENFVLNNCYKYQKIENDRVGLFPTWTFIYVPSESCERKDGELKGTYVVEGDEITLKYVENVREKGYLAAYDSEGVITDSMGTFTIKYLSDSDKSVSERFDEIYSAYADEAKYKLLAHSVLTPKSDDFATWEEISAHYQMAVFPEWKSLLFHFYSYEWDKEALRFAVLDKKSKDVIEVVVFNRTDGNYMAKMIYPKKNKDLRNEMYWEFVNMDIRVDMDPIFEMSEKLVMTETRADDGALTVAVKNGSDYVIPTLGSCVHISYVQKDDVKSEDLYGREDYYDIQPGEIVYYNFSAEQMKNCETYEVEVWASAKSRMLETSLSEERRNMLKFGK